MKHYETKFAQGYEPNLACCPLLEYTLMNYTTDYTLRDALANHTRHIAANAFKDTPKVTTTRRGNWIRTRIEYADGYLYDIETEIYEN